MMTGPDQPVPVKCPRCGGAMYKPAGSLFYWHANTTHPRCNITNLLLPVSSVVESSAEAAESTQKKPS